ncbi:MAG TPA: sensor histidine kinase [Actinomycetes bacterium]
MTARRTARWVLDRPRPRAWAWFLAACALAAAVEWLVTWLPPRLRGPPATLLDDSVALAASAAILVGVRWYRPDRLAPWYLLSLALALNAAADVTSRFLSGSGSPLLANLPGVLKLAAYPLGGIAALLVLRQRSPGRDLAGLLDALIVVAGLGLLAWTFLVVGFVRQTGIPVTDKLNYLSAPLLGILVVALAVRLPGGGPATTALRLLLAGVVVLLVSDTLLAVSVLAGVDLRPDPTGPISMLGFACLGAAALHPSIRTLQDRTLPTPARLTRWRIVLLLGVALVTPTLLAVQAMLGRPVGLPLLLVGVSVLFGLVVTRMSGLVAAETARSALGELVLDRMVAATEEERTRVAAELHDGPLQRLAAIFYTTELVQSRLALGDVAQGRQLVRSLGDQVGAEMDAIRRLLVELRPPVLDQAGLGPALEQAGAELSRRTGIDCRVTAGSGLRLDANRETVLYRVAQEALTNVAKHAQARHVRVGVAVEGRSARLEVADDGVGFDPARLGGPDGRHFGLTLMRQRVAMAGGTLQVRARPGQGTTLTVHLPLSSRAAATRDGRGHRPVHHGIPPN